jgi:hypothetical protein
MTVYVVLQSFLTAHDADRGRSSSSRVARGFLLGVPNMSLVALA